MKCREKEPEEPDTQQALQVPKETLLHPRQSNHGPLQIIMGLRPWRRKSKKFLNWLKGDTEKSRQTNLRDWPMSERWCIALPISPRFSAGEAVAAVAWRRRRASRAGWGILIGQPSRTKVGQILMQWKCGLSINQFKVKLTARVNKLSISREPVHAVAESYLNVRASLCACVCLFVRESFCREFKAFNLNLTIKCIANNEKVTKCSIWAMLMALTLKLWGTIITFLRMSCFQIENE
jgi:hypothetical protein